MMAVIVFSGLKNIIENEAEGKTCDAHSPFEIISVQQCLYSDLLFYFRFGNTTKAKSAPGVQALPYHTVGGMNW